MNTGQRSCFGVRAHRFLALGPRPSPGVTTKESLSLLRLEHRETFVGIKDVALDVGGLGWTSPELVHRADEAHPIEDFLLAAVFDRAQRALPPCRVIRGLQCFIEGAVGLDIGVEQAVLGGQKGVRPARRSDQRDAPRAFLGDLRAGRAEVEAAPRGRGGCLCWSGSRPPGNSAPGVSL